MHLRPAAPGAAASRVMPELPDITAYLDALQPRVVGQPLETVRLGNPFLVRTIDPRRGELAGRRVEGLASARQADRLRASTATCSSSCT